MIKQRNDYIKALEAIGFDNECRTKAIKYVKEKDIKAHGKEIPFSYVPLFIDQRDLDYFNGELHILHGILGKITQHYVDDHAYRKLFHFSSAMENLICLPCDYDEMIPIGRYDIFYDERTGDYSFCEFNTDGSGGMSRDLEMTDAILSTFKEALVDFPETAKIVQKYDFQHFNTINMMAESMINIYRSTENAVNDPVFCVTDFKEEGVMSDFVRFIKAFQDHGISARFTDIRDLFFDGTHLIDKRDGTVIHAIYRRAVTSVILEHLDECTGLIEAVKAKKVTLIGHFRTSIVHSKTIFYAMYHPDTIAFLSDEEIAYIHSHIPQTYKMERCGISDVLMEEVITHKDKWIIKPEEGFGSYGVVSGMDVSQAEWEKQIRQNMDQHYVVQQFCPRYAVPLLGPDDQGIEEYPLMLGIYQSCGKAVGFYSRAGKAGVIDFDHGGICVSTVFSTMIDEIISLKK